MNGTEESKETLEFHAGVLLSQVAALRQLNTYHRSWPWKAVLFLLDAQQWKHLLPDLRKTWTVVCEVADVVPNDHPLCTELSITRHQAFRDLMINGEFLPAELQNQKL